MGIMAKYALLILLVFLLSDFAFGLSVTPASFTADVLFDRPQNSVEYFSAGSDVEVTNENPFPVFLNATSSGNCSGIKAGINSITIPNNTAVNISVFLDVPSSLKEGSYTCDVKFFTNKTISGVTGEAVYSKATVRVKWPSPGLAALWDSDLGKLKAGETYKREISLTETMGYASATGATLTISFLSYDGPAVINKPFYFIGEVKPFETKKISVEVSIPERNLTPGNYTLQTTPFAKNNKPEDNVGYYVMYEIPYPMMAVIGDLNFSSLTFVPGKDSGIKEIEVRETGGYTPIEGLNITQVYGDLGWITYPEVDYVLPGEPLNINFKITAPENAEIGKREWKFLLNTKYAGFRAIDGSVLVYFPKIDEAITELNQMEKNKLVENLIKIMEITKQKTRKEDILDVMGSIYIYSASYSLITQISLLRKSTDDDERLSAISLIKRDIDRIKIANGVLKDENLKGYSIKIIESSKSIWNGEISNTIKKIEEDLKNYETNNYRLCAIYYQKLSDIYGGLEDKQSKCEEKYKMAVENASKIKSEIEKISLEIDEKTVNIGTKKILLNPFDYDSVMKKYDSDIEKHDLILPFYANAGEKNDAELWTKKRESLKEEKNFITLSFIIYGAVVFIILLIIVARISIGITAYNRDEAEKELGDVVMG